MLLKHFVSFVLLWLIVIAPLLCKAARIEALTQRNTQYFASGEVIQFNCYFDNTRFRFEHFSHDGSRIFNDDRNDILSSGDHVSLSIVQARSSDQGMYSCTLLALELARPESVTFYATVTYEEDVVIYLEQDQRFIGATGTPHTLYCHGEHIRTWRWSKEGRGLTNSSDGRLQILDGERLHFTELLPSDAGMYGCTVTNRVSNEYKVFRFDVFDLPEVTITKQPSYAIQETNAVNLTCVASGTDLMSLTWSRESDGTELTVSTSSVKIINVIANSTLRIIILQFVAVSRSQQDTYRCTANSSVGSSYRLTELSLSGLPGAPPAPLLEVVNVTMVMVQLQSPDDTGRLTISQYHINYGEVDHVHSMKQLAVPASQTQVVIQLRIATEYFFSVAARNQNGQGPFSAQGTIMTLKTVPVAVDVQVGDVHSDSAVLSWELLESKNDTGGSPVTSYDVTYWTSRNKQNKTTLTGVLFDDSHYTLTDLWDNNMYHVIVCACNSVGCGQPSPVVNFTTVQALPGQVDDVKVTDSSDGNFVTISWRPNLIGQPILYYIIDVKQPGSPDFALSKPRNYSASQIRGDIYSVTVTEVNKDQCYHFNITGGNDKGLGESQVFIWNCNSTNPSVGSIQVSDDGKPNTSVIIAIVVSALLLLLIVIVVACVIITLKRCRRYRQDDEIDKKSRSDNSSRRDSDMSKTAVLFNYNHSDSYGTQDSISSQLSAPRTIGSYVSEQMHFTMSSNGPLDPKEKNSPFGDRPRLASPDDGGVVWTVGPAASNDIIDYDEAPKSPHIPEPSLSNVDDQMQYTDNEAYFSFSRKQPSSVKSGVKILSDDKNDGKDIVILSVNR